MTAVIGEEIKDLQSLLGGLRIAKVLWGINNKFFDYFRVSGSYDFRIHNTTTQENINNKKYTIWLNITKSMNEYCQFQINKLEENISNSQDKKTVDESMAELKVSKMNQMNMSFFDKEFLESLIQGDKDSMVFFCTVFILFLKTQYPLTWKEAESHMSPELKHDFRNYLVEFGQSMSKAVTESTSDMTQVSPKHSEYQLL